MDNLATAGPAVGQVYPTNYWFGMVGFLGHDNKLFDRTCTNCKGMYSSYQVGACPKCGQPLTFIRTTKGTAMAISEGTIYPAFGPKQKERHVQSIANRKNGMKAVYRFKVFSFADANGTLPPPENHHLMKSGSKVKIQIVNHEAIPSYFTSKEDQQPRVELMLMIYPQYGDTVEVQAAPKANPAVTVDAAGNAVPIDTTSIQTELAEVKARINVLLQAQGMDPNQEISMKNTNDMTAESVAQDTDPPFDGGTTLVTDGPVDVFAKAI